MNSKLKYILLGIAGSLSLAACSVSSSGGDAPGITPQGGADKFFDPRATITGPKVEGDWKSKCNPDGKGYRTVELLYTATAATKTITEYTDSACAGLKKDKVQTGIYRFIEKLSNDIYVIEYLFKTEKGGQYAGMENLKVEGDKLYFGDNASGEGMGVLTNEPLFRVNVVAPTPGKPAPTPTPAPVSEYAEGATTYAEARYAICNAQGSVFIIDFVSVSLSSPNSGAVRIGTQSCSSAVPSKWYTNAFTATVTISSGQPNVKLINTGSESDRIETWASGTGLSNQGYFKNAFGVVGGNSGPCVFVKNIGKLTNLYPICN